MPLAESLGEFSYKATNVRASDLGGGRTQVEICYAGEVTGDVPGQHFGTLTVTINAIDQPNPWTYLGATLTKSGSVARISGQGLSIRTGDGHKVRYRGTYCLTTDDPKLANFNNVIAAVEAETDPVTQVLKGTGCIWK
jgi:hypothetical protein